MENQKQITENNILLARFIGGLYNNEGRLSLQKNEIWLPNFGVCNIINNNGKCLKFNSDWNWLMKVVEKIESLPHPIGSDIYNFTIIISNNGCEINSREVTNWENIYSSNYVFLNNKHTTSKIEAVYNTCVEFVKWYNENK